jgi:hypothetical protein
MNVMLAVIFASIGVGLFAQKWAHRETLIIFGIATVMVALYLAHPGFMT